MTLEDLRIFTPTLEAFAPFQRLECPACGTTPFGLFSRLAAATTGHQLSVWSVFHCSGNRPPVEDIASPIEAIMRGKSEERPRCGGIIEPHLHLKCNCCGYVRLMRVKS
jgi:hypothetical protein